MSMQHIVDGEASRMGAYQGDIGLQDENEHLEYDKLGQLEGQ